MSRSKQDSDAKKQQSQGVCSANVALAKKANNWHVVGALDEVCVSFEDEASDWCTLQQRPWLVPKRLSGSSQSGSQEVRLFYDGSACDSLIFLRSGDDQQISRPFYHDKAS